MGGDHLGNLENTRIEYTMWQNNLAVLQMYKITSMKGREEKEWPY